MVSYMQCAQGAVSDGRPLCRQVAGGNVQVNHPTVGMVSNGGTVEREIASRVFDSPKQLLGFDSSFPR